MKLFNEYRGLRREIYVLFFGRVVTNMGALIWPMMTLILSNKLHMNASQIATMMLVMSVVSLPCVLIGGKMADHFNKRNVIIICDLITVSCYLAAAMVPTNMLFVILFFVAGLFAQMEWPSYDALVADLTTAKDREKAYSLNYLGANLGLVLAPTIGGFLFKNHLNTAFIINAISTLSSTILIFFLIKDVKRSENTGVHRNAYEDVEENKSVLQVLKDRPLMIFFILISAVYGLIYSQFNYLIPLNLDRLYGSDGAIVFGLLTSLNAFVVIVGTPLITRWCRKTIDISKICLGQCLITIGLGMYIFIQGMMPMYFVSMVIFTLGEIFSTLGNQPYITKRIPASHRGRIASISAIFATVFQSLAQKVVGYLADTVSMTATWQWITLIGLITVVLTLLLKRKDKQVFPVLYQINQNQSE